MKIKFNGEWERYLQRNGRQKRRGKEENEEEQEIKR